MGGDNQNPSAIILAGECNPDRFALARRCPRAVTPVLNRPLLAYMLNWLADSGAERVVICSNGQSEPTRHGLAGSAPSSLDIIWQEDHGPRGAAGCIRDGLEALGQTGPALVLDASVFVADLPRLSPPDDQEGGVCMYCGRRPGQDANLEPAGIRWVWPDVIPLVPPHGYCDLKEQLLPRLHQASKAVRVCELDRLPPRVAGLSDYLNLNYDLLVEGQMAPAGLARLGLCYDQDRQVWHSGPFRAHPSAEFAGPVLLGANSIVGRDSVIVGPTVIGDDTAIGADCYLRDSVLWQGVCVGRGCELTGVLALDGSRLEAGTAACYTSFAADGGGRVRSNGQHGRPAWARVRRAFVDFGWRVAATTRLMG